MNAFLTELHNYFLFLGKTLAILAALVLVIGAVTEAGHSERAFQGQYHATDR